jgi:hypothetical protein
VLDDLARLELHHQHPLVEMFDRKLTTCQGRQEIDLDLNDKIVLLTFETIVRLLLNNNDHVSRLCRWRLITLPPELHGLTALHTLINVHLQKLFLGQDLLALATRTSVLCIDNLAKTRAVVASRLNLLNHRTHLAQCNLDSTATACVARPRGTLLATFPFALCADDVPRQSKFGGLAFVQVFQSDVDTMDEIFGFSWALIS